MKRPEILVTPYTTDDILPLIEAGADAFVVGEERYGLRLAGEFNRDEVKKVIELAHSMGKKVYVAMNAIFHNEKLEELKDYLRFTAEANADAVIFGDPAVLLAAREAAPEMKLHWSTETLGTNWYSVNYWGRKGAKRAVLAREINMDAIVEIAEKSEVEIEVLVHGMTCMFQSKRTLLGNYFEYQGKMLEIEDPKHQKNMFLHDKERGNKYPIFEDENGTHIMSPNDVCIIDELQDMFEAGVDSFKIEGLLKDIAYLTAVTSQYRKAIDLFFEDPDLYENEKTELLAKLEKIQPQNRSLDTGFYFKETVY